MRRVGVLVGAALVAAVAASGVAGAAEPTFVNGLAQNVFSANTADWIRGEGWVQSTYDSDQRRQAGSDPLRRHAAEGDRDAA